MMPVRFLVIIGRTEEMVVVSAGVIERRERIVLHFRERQFRRQFYAQFIKIFAVGRESEFIGIRKPVKSDASCIGRAFSEFSKA